MVDAVNTRMGRAPIKSIDEEIAELVEMVREANERVSEMEAEVRPLIEAAKERLKMLLEHRGSNWADEHGYARVVSEGTRTTYDSKGLDKLILEDPEQYGWLKQYRVETSVKGGISVK